MNKLKAPRKVRVRITKQGDYCGRVGVIVGQDINNHALILKLKNKIISWPATERNYLTII